MATCIQSFFRIIVISSVKGVDITQSADLNCVDLAVFSVPRQHDPPEAALPYHAQELEVGGRQSTVREVSSSTLLFEKIKLLDVPVTPEGSYGDE